MFDRLAPFVVLVLNQLLLGFVFLFGLILSDQDPLPKVGPWFAALIVWAIPNLVKVGRVATSEVRLSRLFAAVALGIRAGYITLAAALVLGVLLRLLFPGLPWGVIGFFGFGAANLVEGRQLRRQLESLKLLEP